MSDIVDCRKPDERSVMTYVAQYFHAFSALNRIEHATSCISKFATVMQSAWESENDYEARIQKVTLSSNYSCEKK